MIKRILLASVAAVCLSGCGERERVEVTIIKVYDEPTMGMPDKRTVIEYPSGKRVILQGAFGEPGDTFNR